MTSDALRVRRLQPADREEWRRMRHELWPDETPEDADRGMAEWEARADATVFVAVRSDGSVCGFVEAGSRPYADGCETSPVGYVEGWYVDPDVRREGHGRALLAAAEDWARSKGFQEMASDALIDNEASRLAHLASGYEEVGRVIQFRKALRKL
jgi:aminoglycoside 6'-N-acetyltransferase I